MKNITIKFLVLIEICVFIAATDITAQISQTSSVQSTAGGKAESSSYTHLVSIGQPIPLGKITSSQYTLLPGFIPVVLGSADNLSPSIDHTTIISAPENQVINVEANIIDNIEVYSASLFYRMGGDASYTGVFMQANGNIYSAVIPSASVTSRGVEYYIESIDISGNISRHPSNGIISVQISVSGEGLVKSGQQPAGSEQIAYRLISIPLSANNKNPVAILEDDLGSYDKTKWRFFGLQTNQSYLEFPNTFQMDPGMAFWLIVKDPGKFIDTGPAVSNITSSIYRISLNAGWTFIGNPFNFAIPLSQATLENDSVLTISSYSGTWREFSSSLLPFDGYAVYSEENTNLLIDPDLTGLKKGSPLQNENDGVIWEISINASCQSARDIDNKAIVSTGSSKEWDKFDRPEPPIIGEYVSVYFPHLKWNKISKNYCVDARPDIIEGEIWDFEVSTNIADEVKLSFEGCENVPNDFEIWMFDGLIHSAQDLRITQNYVLYNKDIIHPRNLSLIVGTNGFVKETFNKLQILPMEYVLFQNFPNPFNPTTTIRFAIPEEEFVTLKVFNIIGQEVVALLKNERKSAGYHAVYWNGKDRSGRYVASGIYLYSLTASKFSGSKKMMMIK